MATMRAIVANPAHPNPLVMEEVEAPIPAPNEVVVRVAACGQGPCGFIKRAYVSFWA